MSNQISGQEVHMPKPEWTPTPEELEGNKISYCYMTQDCFPLRPLPMEDHGTNQ